jgi:hypothetical protein
LRRIFSHILSHSATLCINLYAFEWGIMNGALHILKLLCGDERRGTTYLAVIARNRPVVTQQSKSLFLSMTSVPVFRDLWITASEQTTPFLAMTAGRATAHQI